ncbi:hypothetical protein PDJAM_G00174460 [Pangasius djambal]|uniref:Uncharacterized protein n=1 Tax=Pangasius djambal TaxID=1691987 RepID=A0ACC5ZPR7_9TELE|nr:hypothetical protein [Pangasius djambal]
MIFQVVFRMSGSNISPSPLSTTSNQSEETLHTSSYESESNESDEREDSRVKLPSIPSPHMVEVASPVSVKSDQSVAPGIAFKYSVSWDKPNSPAVSYSSMASVQSMNTPLKFSREPDVEGRNEAASPAPTLASFQSEQSMEPPATFSCRHSFCKTRIPYYWTKPTHAGSCCCPQYRKRFKTRPALNLNRTLANVVQTQQQAGFSPALLTQSYTGPGDVACDMCSGSRIRAVKSCLTCCTSYCESHVRRHYTVEALQEHILREPTKDLEQEVYNTNTPAEVGLKDLMSSMMNEMKGLKNTINKMRVKLEDVQRGITPVTEARPPRKRIRTELKEGES